MSLSVSGSGQMILDELDEKLSDSPVQYIDKKRADKTIHVICHSGQCAYYATRLLLQKGFDARNVSGGMLSKAHTSFFLQEGPIE
jgi:rhodanese-related sulfurtransferase